MGPTFTQSLVTNLFSSKFRRVRYISTQLCVMGVLSNSCFRNSAPLCQARRWSLFSLERKCRRNSPQGKMKNLANPGTSGSCSFLGHTNLRPLIRIMRIILVSGCIGKTDWIYAFAPTPTVNPMLMLQLKTRAEKMIRKRAVKRSPL